MTAMNYTACLRETLRWEGGYSDHPKDPGGPTMRGVTQRVYDGYRDRRGLPKQNVRKIGNAELQDIYRDQYWHAVHGDELPAGVDLAVFDFAVNSGPTRAIKSLQAWLGVKVDGALGEVTLAAVRNRTATSVIDGVCDRRMAFLRALPTWSTFGDGWTRRVSAVKQQARDIAINGAVRAPAETPPLPDVPAQPSAKAEPAPSEKPSTDKAIAVGTAGAGVLATIIGAIDSPYGLAALIVLLTFVGALAWRLWPKATMPEMQA